MIAERTEWGPMLEYLAFSDRLLEGQGVGLLAFDPEGHVLFWNRGMARITGVSATDALGKNLFQLFPVLGTSGEDGPMKRALAGETVALRARPYAIAHRARGAHFDVHYAPLAGANGAPIGATGVIRDIPARTPYEEQLRETEGRFQTMADAAPVLLWMSETDSLCTFFNQTWLDFTGRTFEEEWGVGWAEGVHFEDLQKCIDTYVDAFGERRVFEMEYRLRRRDGDYRWILDRGTPRYTPDGSFAGYIGSCVDITDRKQMEGELLKAVRDRDDFLSIASHELRTPLTTLQLEIESLKRSLDRRPEAALASGRLARNADVANTQVARLVSLVDELLDVSRLASGRLAIHPVEFDLCELVSDVATRLKPSFEAARCPVEVATPARTVGVWDRQRVEQVVTNLIANAIKYGAGKPIELTVQGSNGAACFQVRDYGIGIAPEDHGRIFQRFERAASTSNYGGFGLGLWISREIIAAHGGTIDVESDTGCGSMFAVRLPLRPSS